MIQNPPPWPDGARCAVAFTFDMDADSILHLDHHESAHNRVAALSMLRYGPQVGVPRVLEIYRRFGMRQTFFLPGWCMERYPEAVEAILEGGHEIANHSYLHEHANELEPEVERDWLRRGIEVFERMTGARPRGFRAALYQASRHTHELLVAEGFGYDASLFGDDVPYLLEAGGGSLVELPSHWGVDDWPQYMFADEFHYRLPVRAPRRAAEVFMDEFDAAWEYGGLWVAVWHPFLSGRLARAHAIAKLIEYMNEKGGVWFATMEEIAAHVRRLVDAGEWSPRIDRLPYYEGPIPELGTVTPALVRRRGG